MSSVPLSPHLEDGTRDKEPKTRDSQWDSVGTLAAEGASQQAPAINKSGTPTETDAGHPCPAAHGDQRARCINISLLNRNCMAGNSSDGKVG
jgi:hypothetical protein